MCGRITFKNLCPIHDLYSSPIAEAFVHRNILDDHHDCALLQWQFSRWHAGRCFPSDVLQITLGHIQSQMIFRILGSSFVESFEDGDRLRNQVQDLIVESSGLVVGWTKDSTPLKIKR